MGGVVERRKRLLASGIAASIVLAACTTTSTGAPPTPGAGSFLSSARNAANDADRIFLLQQALQAGENAYEANSGLGQIYLRQADSGANRSASLCSAAGSYAAAAQASSGAQRADALTARAGALLQLNRLGATSCAGSQEFRTAADFQTRAFAEYQAAIAADGSAPRHFALANAYRSVGQLDAADTAYTAGLGAGATGSARAAALAAQAEIRSQLPGRYSTAQVLASLEEAASADPNLPQVNLARGTIYLNQGDLVNARSAFDRVRTSGAVATAGQANPTAEAYYYLSVIDGLEGGSAKLASAVTNAEAAVRNGGADVRYRQQGCLALIARGQVVVEGDDAQVYQNALGEWCNVATGTPEGVLLRGLSNLRLAQYSAAAGSTSAHRDRLVSARTDLGSALSMAQGLPESARSLRLTGRPALWLRDVQDYGARTIEVCFGVPPDPNDPYRPERAVRADIEKFYADYKLNVCRV